MTDPAKRPLIFPKWHIPYLEKHRILELFHEIARELVIQKPDDHILFIKQILQQAASSIDVSRVVLIGSPRVNKKNIATEIAKHTQQIVITLNDLKNMFAIKADHFSADLMAKTIACLVRTMNVAQSGWILADCINTEEEAKAIIKLGVLPTHVLFLIPPFQPNLEEPLYCNIPENWPQLRRNLFALRDVFKKTIREVPLTSKNVATVAKECIEIIKTKAPVKRVRPRVVILGPRGSGKKTQARLLAGMMGLINIDFDYILCQAWTSDSELGEKLRQCNKRVCFHSELLCQIVNKRILEDDCLKQGWVLTGYPYTVTDFRFLDSLQTPPNRVVIVDCDINGCNDRIRYRKYNAYTGSTVNLIPTKSSANKDEAAATRTEEVNTNKKVLKVHPKDTVEYLQAEQDFYCQNYVSIKKYCGDTAMVVNGDQNERWVYECISAYVVGPNPNGPPRKGFGEEVPEVCSCDCVDIPPLVAKAYVITV